MAEQERTLQWWKDAILNGMRFQIKFAKSNMWNRYKSYYRHEFKDGIVPVNLVFSILRSVVPQVYFKDPHVIITPTKPGLEYELHARLVESIDNWLLRELSTKYEIKKMIADAFLCGLGNGFTGYDSEYGYDPKKTIDEKGQASLTQFNKKGYRIEYNAHVSPGMPWFLRARPEDVVYPWGCESSYNAEWVAMRVFRPLADIKVDPKYKNTEGLAGSYTQQRTTPAGGTKEYTQDTFPMDHEWVELWQVRDAKTGKILAFTMDHDKFLRDEADLLQIDGLPVDTLVFNPDPDYVYGIPDTRIIEPQLLELNEIRTQAMKHRRVDIVKLLYKKGAIKKEALDRLLDERVQAAVEIEAEGTLGESVLPITSGVSGILADLANMGEVVRGDVRESVGFSRSATGEYMGKTHISAAETDVVQWAGQIRIDERRDAVADLLTSIVRRFNQLVFTHWTTDMVRSVTGPDGARWWLKFNPSEIKSEYNIKVDPNNAIPVDQRTRKQDAMEMIRAWSEMNMGKVKAGMPVPPELQRYFFSQFEGIDIDKLIAQDNQGSQAMQQMGGQGGPGGPNAPVPPQIAAQMMQQQRGGA